MSEPLPAPAPPKPKPWWQRDVKRLPVWLLILLGALLVGAIVVGQVNKSKDDTTTPATIPAGTEACAALADPANARLHPSDWRRIGHWTQSEMEAYVSAHCPEELSRVRD